MEECLDRYADFFSSLPRPLQNFLEHVYLETLLPLLPPAFLFEPSDEADSQERRLAVKSEKKKKKKNALLIQDPQCFYPQSELQPEQQPRA